MRVFRSLVTISIVWVIIASLAMGTFTSQPALAKKKKGPLSQFSHRKHKKYFEANNIECVGCHPFSVSLYEQKQDIKKAISGKLLQPAKESCHYCHNNPEQANVGPNKCSICHTDMQAVLPSSHSADWIDTHQTVAKANEAECKQCHKSHFCIMCHQRRDPINQVMHTRNFRYFHSIEARANPRYCDSCHRVTFCEDCHRSRSGN